MRGKKLVLLILALILIAASIFLLRIRKESIYFGLSYAKTGDKLKIIVNDKVIHQETFSFNYPAPQDYFMMSEKNRYTLVSNFVPRDSILKVELILNDTKDTTIRVNTTKVKGINVDCYRGKISVFYDYREGGLKYLFKEG